MWLRASMSILLLHGDFHLLLSLAEETQNSNSCFLTRQDPLQCGPRNLSPLWPSSGLAWFLSLS